MPKDLTEFFKELKEELVTVVGNIGKEVVVGKQEGKIPPVELPKENALKETVETHGKAIEAILSRLEVLEEAMQKASVVRKSLRVSDGESGRKPSSKFGEVFKVLVRDKKITLG
ncbi:MAG: hypothetical protein DDT40_01910 [candidate division WS2 bacterium]|nr:hypothetical protein [Candidatus Psychracetigena formicireducens]